MALLGFGAPAAVLGAFMMMASLPLGFCALVIGVGATVSARRDHEPAGPAEVGLTCGALVALSLVAALGILVAG